MHVNTHLEGAPVEWIRYGYHLKTLRLRQVHSLGRITDLSKYSHSSFSFSEISFLGDRIGESLIGPISWILFLNESCLFRAVLYESRSKPANSRSGRLRRSSNCLESYRFRSLNYSHSWAGLLGSEQERRSLGNTFTKTYHSRFLPNEISLFIGPRQRIPLIGSTKSDFILMKFGFSATFSMIARD